jgi:hypothetical protein
MTGDIGSAVTGGGGLSGMTSLGTVTIGTLGSGVTFPAGHVLRTFKIMDAEDLVGTGGTNAGSGDKWTYDSDANDLDIASVASGNILMVWVIGGRLETNSTATYGGSGIYITDQSGSTLYRGASKYSSQTNFVSPVAACSHIVGSTGAVKVKKGVMNNNDSFTTGWYGSGYSTGNINMIVMEVQG